MGDIPARTKIFVVSLRDAQDRKKMFVALNMKGAHHWQFFNACEALHPNLDYDEDAAIVAKGRPLTRGELGCYSSHYALWQQLVDDDDADQYIVLEDDVIADWRYIEKFAAVRHEDAGNNYIRLYYKKPSPFRIVQKNYLARSTSLVEVSGYCFGTQAYLLTKGGARHFIGRMQKVVRPIDDEMDRSWSHGMPNRAVFPFPVIERAVGSDIGGARFRPFDIPPRLRLKRFVARNMERLRYRLGARRMLP